MRLGLYGLPCAGKSYLLQKVDFMPVLAGSQLLRRLAPDFSGMDEAERDRVRRRLAHQLTAQAEFIMDGHYAFGEQVVFTPEDGRLYDAFLYLWIPPELLRERMENSERNAKYLKYDPATWQQSEVDGLRAYCHAHGKDFYVLDCPEDHGFSDLSQPLDFIRAVSRGYSCRNFAQQCVWEILSHTEGDRITLLDGDRTLTLVDTSRTVLDYQTALFDGNFYTGYQSWRQAREFQTIDCTIHTPISVPLNRSLLDRLSGPCCILTTGHVKIWRALSAQLDLPCFSGQEMSAETKLFITQGLQRSGKRVIAFGDSMNDYFMLRQADEGYLVKRPDGSVSRSLAGQSLEGIYLV